MNLALHGVGHFHPDSQITNRFLEELDIGTSNEWIVERVGILARRSVLPLDYIRETRNADLRQAAEAAEYSNVDLAARAAELALERAGLRASDVGMLISGSSTPQSSAPAEACLLAQRLGVAGLAFDVNSACTSFAVAIHLLAKMPPEALPEFVLVTAVEGLTRRVDYTDRNTAVLFGDGAAAAVMSTRHPGRARILHTQCESDPTGAGKVRIPDMQYFSQDGRAVQVFAIKKTALGYERLRKHEDPRRPLHFIGHQANLRVLETVCTRASIRPERHHFNVEHYGNTGAPSAASVLSMQWDKWRSGDDVAVVVVGAGLTRAEFLVRFDGEAGGAG